ncbi:MAG: hypothetical protein GY754_04665 [bacterium]|nr:hypothetical protein [bacterium]
MTSLQLSIFAHIQYISNYIKEKSNAHLKGFLITTATNFIFGITLSIIAMANPVTVQRLPIEALKVLEAGLFFFLFLFIKIRITIRIIKRAKDPANYHLSHFGKKVYKESIATKPEVAIYLITMPFTLLIGAYFIARILDLN